MTLAIYDTFATAPDGRILHFDVIAPVTMTPVAVEQAVARQIGGDHPEVEILRRSQHHLTASPEDASIMRQIEQDGIAFRQLDVSRRRSVA